MKEANGNGYLRTVYRTEEFCRFYDTLSPAIQEKYDYTIEIVQCIYNLPTKFAKKLTGTPFYEIRVAVGTNAYRTLLFATNSDNLITATEIYLLNSFLKKSEKDYKRQIDRAEKMIKDLEL